MRPTVTSFLLALGLDSGDTEMYCVARGLETVVSDVSMDSTTDDLGTDDDDIEKLVESTA